jgi:methionyl-tRNA formyltransferase
MFDTIILLTGPIESEALPGALLGHNPNLTILTIQRAEDLAALDGDVLRRSRLIAFVTSVIVPKSILDQLGYGAVNFHPGPPDYPGWAPAHFSLYDQADEFGATVHLMVEKVDAGPIIDLAMFPVPPETTVFGLEGMAYARLAFLFWRMARELACQVALPPALGVEWGRHKF